ncbi:DUF2964 family protein [Burkholderia gladioli]|uniref:DUF2964 domain-containing protein n=1 Tax=Burkholderia gladioli (strain BSR3) TaxID=999541 RepID=F2L8J2_BURGS|nr:DUF2964 family protein [Burkholderia gladioli]AEA60763.1 hypothetical protein bgla_1g21290 [Burkholderia gladioli BSR3]MBW5286288.1 DUF2964 family protein [Burkholderia gladioli]NHH79647.1 hypothetical protein [Burkholderia gladioli]CAG9238256.1 conserved hypothetical protein [Burkholderia gladioli]
MIRKPYRITLATLCALLALASLVAMLDGMLFDERVFRFALVTLMTAILSFAALLAPAADARD